MDRMKKTICAILLEFGLLVGLGSGVNAADSKALANPVIP